MWFSIRYFLVSVWTRRLWLRTCKCVTCTCFVFEVIYHLCLCKVTPLMMAYASCFQSCMRVQKYCFVLLGLFGGLWQIVLGVTPLHWRLQLFWQALCVWSQDTDASVTETRINWTRWKRVPNFKPLSCTWKAPFFKSSEIVFSLCMKNVRVSFTFKDCSSLDGLCRVK